MPETIEKVGLLGPDGELLYVSDANSMVGSEFDGPCLWNSLEEAQRDNEEVGGVAEGWHFVKVTLVVGEKLS